MNESSTSGDISQLVLLGYEGVAASNHRFKKKNVAVILAKLRKLHDELNAQLYSYPTQRPSINSPGDAANILQPFLGHLDHEELWIVDLDTRNRVMRLVALYKGSVNSSQGQQPLGNSSLRNHSH
jgi:DNA repair protein RadC